MIYLAEQLTTYDLEIIAGPCSINQTNINEIWQIADIRDANGPIVSGTRVVGLKSRTELDPLGNGMGIDFKALELLDQDPGADVILPSAKIAEDVVRETHMLVATEVMEPHIQLPQFAGRVPEGKLLAWNPSVNQLGWQVRRTSVYAMRHGWSIGLKNGKALGATLSEADDPNAVSTPMEKTWAGLATYAAGVNEVILIHRGVDVPEKGDYRNAPVHEAARRVKQRNPDTKLFLDPSHICGPKLRDTIVDFTVQSMHMKNNGGWLYDGVLIEAGTSDTDTRQHISLRELEDLARELSAHRRLRSPEPAGTIFRSVVVGVRGQGA
ncbi:MAG: hypothetical protein HYV40_03480 [Candidatus Levybacteria bacterium]|nr:hypothetical protein [Candidatus Levybacteria bacterium]